MDVSVDGSESTYIGRDRLFICRRNPPLSNEQQRRTLRQKPNLASAMQKHKRCNLILQTFHSIEQTSNRKSQTGGLTKATKKRAFLSVWNKAIINLHCSASHCHYQTKWKDRSSIKLGLSPIDNNHLGENENVSMIQAGEILCPIDLRKYPNPNGDSVVHILISGVPPLPIKIIRDYIIR